jgi:alpha-tubulin suppressor-like RCC1 family protein
MALLENGQLYTWGNNENGACGWGIDARFARQEPTLVTGTYKRIAAGTTHAAALDSHNQLYVWGANRKCQLGYS